MKNQIYNALHVLLMFGIVYLIGNIAHFNEFTTEGKIIGIPIASFIIGWVLGLFLEYAQAKIVTDSFSKLDLLLYGIGGFLGGIASIFFSGLSILSMLFISLYLIGAIFAIVKK